MGSAVYATAVPANGTLVPEQPQPALRARGASDRAESASRTRRGLRASLAGLIAARRCRSAPPQPQRAGVPRRRTSGASSAATPRLTGVSASTPPATLKLLWTYDAGDVIDSSAAIADGVVYVGGGDGDLIALDLASGELRWKYATGNLIGESSPAVGADAVYIGDLGGILHAVSTRDGKALWTFKTDVGDQVFARGRPWGQRRRPDRLVRRPPLRARRAHRPSAMEGPDQGPGARDAGRAGRAGVRRRLRRDVPGDSHRRRTRGIPDRVWRVHRRRRLSWTAIAPTSAPSTTKCWRST